MPLVFRTSRHTEGEGVANDSSNTGAAIGFGAGVAAAAAFAYAVHKAARLRSSVGSSHWKSHLAQDGTVPDFEALLQHVAEKGLDPEVRPEIWPLLLGVYDPDESTEHRAVSHRELRQRYEALLQQCQDMETACLGHIAMRRSTARTSSGGSATATAAIAGSSLEPSEALKGTAVGASRHQEGSQHADVSPAPAAEPPNSATHLLQTSSETAPAPAGADVAHAGDGLHGFAAVTAIAVAGLAVAGPHPPPPPCFGRLSRADIPPALRPFWEAQQSIALDVVRTDFKKANLPGSVVDVSCTADTGGGGGGGGFASSLRSLSMSIRGASEGGALCEAAQPAAAAALRLSLQVPAPAEAGAAMESVGGGGGNACSSSTGGSRLASWLRERMEGSSLYQAARAVRQQSLSLPPQPPHQQEELELKQPQQLQLQRELSEGQQEPRAQSPEGKRGSRAGKGDTQDAAVDHGDSQEGLQPYAGDPRSSSSSSASTLAYAEPPANADPSGSTCDGDDDGEIANDGGPPLLPSASPSTSPFRQAAMQPALSLQAPPEPVHSTSPLGVGNRTRAKLAASATTITAQSLPNPAIRTPSFDACPCGCGCSQAIDRLQSAMVAPADDANASGAFQGISGAAFSASSLSTSLSVGPRSRSTGVNGTFYNGADNSSSDESQASSGGGGDCAASWLSGLVRFHLDTHAAHFIPAQRRLLERLVTLLSAHAAHDPVLGYCQGMSDLALPFVLMLEDDVVAFWCFAKLMTKVRPNLQPLPDGVFAPLAVLWSLLSALDPPLGAHLARLQAQPCHFAHRMVAVQMRRELPIDLAVRLWEQLWADDALEARATRREAEQRSLERSRAAEAGAVELAEIGGTAGEGGLQREVQPAGCGDIGPAEVPEALEAAADTDTVAVQSSSGSSLQAAALASLPADDGKEDAAATASATALASTASNNSNTNTLAGADTCGPQPAPASAASAAPPSFGRELFPYLIAAVVLSHRRRLLECGELDDVLRVFQSPQPLGRGDVGEALRRARELRERLAPRKQQAAAVAAAAPTAAGMGTASGGLGVVGSGRPLSSWRYWRPESSPSAKL